MRKKQTEARIKNLEEKVGLLTQRLKVHSKIMSNQAEKQREQEIENTSIIIDDELFEVKSAKELFEETRLGIFGKDTITYYQNNTGHYFYVRILYPHVSCIEDINGDNGIIIRKIKKKRIKKILGKTLNKKEYVRIFGNLKEY